ncbi:MAG TPA: ComEC/Rec2 family competence protein [Panacibacter sp.]|nr:ComEC/Rec2 family competence protein [Panacibacter sp.]
MIDKYPWLLKKHPFIKLLAPLIAGIILQWYLQFSINLVLASAGIVILMLACFFFVNLQQRFTVRWLQGALIIILITLTGAIVTFTKDIRNKPGWLGKSYEAGDSLILTLEEPLVEKANSYKALASVNAVESEGSWINTQGKIVVYFKKGSDQPPLVYGSKILLQKTLQPITNSGNPGGFDYERYCLFQDITAQVFLKADEYIVLPGSNINWLQQKIFEIRDAVIKTLQQNITGDKEQGVAEALLIGYRNDLDKDLVQAYSNTGVVHIIAISGLHLGMIYGLLLAVFSRFKKYRLARWIQPLVILFVLWAFTLVAGAAPSILRSAVMFSFIVAGASINRKTNMYNTLAASAFCMLVYNPFMLWDVGFLLSYAAVVSIVTFMQPVYKWFYFRNKMADKVWGLTSVTISAQVFTIPVVVFYFHQFPNFFLVTNFIAVPLSGLILYGEILLLCISFISGLAKLTGAILALMVKAMDLFIEYINQLPFAVWSNLQLNILQTWLLFGCTVAACFWLMKKSTKAFVVSTACLTLLIIFISIDFIKTNEQQKLVVYNVPKQSAIDIIQGRNYAFTGDSILQQDGFLRNFHLKPARILYRTRAAADSGSSLQKNRITEINGKKILVIDSALNYREVEEKIAIDVIILSKNPKLYISQLQDIFDFKTVVFDSSNPLWKTELWKKDCESLHLRFHSVAQQGAFVMDL